MRYALTLLLLLLAGVAAFAGYPSSSRFPPVGYFGPGDKVTGAVAWYSCNRAYSKSFAASGSPICNLTRASDNHRCDFLIAPSGSAGNTTANCTTGGDNGQSISSFCNATTCSVFTMYDQTQSGVCNGSCDITQASVNRFVFSFNCIGTFTCLISNGNVNAGLTSVGNETFSQPVTSVGVAKSTFSQGTLTTVMWFGAAGWGFNGNSSGSGTASTLWSYAGACCGSVTQSDNNFHAISVVFNNTNSSIFVDGTNTTGLSIGGNTGNQNIFLGGNAGGHPSPDFVVEIGVWPSALSAVAQTTLCQNEQAYYGPSNFPATC